MTLEETFCAVCSVQQAAVPQIEHGSILIFDHHQYHHHHHRCHHHYSHHHLHPIKSFLVLNSASISLSLPIKFDDDDNELDHEDGNSDNQ